MSDLSANSSRLLCAVVDASGVGCYYPAALGRYGIECVHVLSDSPDINMRHDQHGILVTIEHKGNIENTVEQLRGFHANYVLPGCESGVELANVLANRLGAPGNGMRNPRALRNKLEMVKAVRQAGLSTAETQLSPIADDHVAWARTRDKWPVVLKPAESAGADNVIFCFSPADVLAAHKRIMSSVDRYGRPNRAVIAQQFLDGEEYYINTVSRNGIHYISEIWHYHKRWILGNRRIYDYEHPVDAGDPAAEIVGRYTLAILDALDIKNGPAHTEVMNTSNGPVLVESAARLCGTQLPHLVSRCFGTNQVELTALSIARPDDFAKLMSMPYQLNINARYVSLINPRQGIVPSDSALLPIRSLPSFAEIELTQPAGYPLPQTVDMATSAGYVYLMSGSRDQLEADYRRLREIENDLYVVPV